MKSEKLGWPGDYRGQPTNNEGAALRSVLPLRKIIRVGQERETQTYETSTLRSIPQKL